ncbi:bifunctional [glutamate--ammonia ligase]-adenylyl-L-tyrosine phosphorylase/[glutamate--ammonia-ligase] adenylyltransferase [Alcaligenaceae bacterium A4P071]|nr:bifunctional [glutamate--ammonia ligase]-adenylyl-L-tyrosine phosphorylase/[glutamate--ammonia-ligase] adenylyltransferase [Alcaligenaceae bacterium A4P071]
MSASVSLAPALVWSGHLRRRLDALPALRTCLEDTVKSPVTPAVLTNWFETLSGAPLGAHLTQERCRAALRQLRERVFCTLMARDIAGQAPLAEVVGAMTALADLAVAAAYRCVAAEMVEVHGTPRDPATGAPQEMLIMGMGKLGGCELNVSSDIDLVMLYGEEGDTDGRRPISHHEFYGRLTRRMMPIISEVDANGQVFRTDLRLRPDGDGGPLAWSLEAFENYLVGQGREWERYAWLKARPIAATAFEGSDSTAQYRQLEMLRTAFVYRKYFDFDALASLRSLRERIRQDWERRASARSGIDTANNIKLGDGGIREIEFVVQLSQLIRGGRMPALQLRGLLEALQGEREAGILQPDDADRLAAAYGFLRQVEHALQYREDAQTHLLPADPELRVLLAGAMRQTPEAFEAELAAHRAFVAQTFHNAFRTAGIESEGSSEASQPCADATPDDAETRLTTLVETAFSGDTTPLLQRVEALQRSHRVRTLPDNSRKRLEVLLPAALQAAARTDAPIEAAARLLDLIETIAQRSAYLALLAEYPETLARVARMMAASPWAAQYLTQHPLLLDSLIDWRTLFQPLDFPQIAAQLTRDLNACVLPDGEPDVERQMNLMRDVQRQASFQLLAQDLENELTVERLADQLSALADLLLNETIRRVWPLVNKRPELEPKFAVIAYGKLGGKELGYVSDLDIVFLFDDDRDDAAEVYAKLARRMTSWLSTMTSSGRLYEVDLRLRPDGDAGLLAVSVEAFAYYQQKHAWVWEHQAITRARFAAGNTDVGEQFEKIRRDVLLMPRDPERLREEVWGMREKIGVGHRNTSDRFDLKHDHGGMVDVEFTTQFLVLLQSAAHPDLAENLGNITLLRLAAREGLIAPDIAENAGNAYRVFRRLQHQLRMQGHERARVAPEKMAAHRAAVDALWQSVLGADAPATKA